MYCRKKSSAAVQHKNNREGFIVISETQRVIKKTSFKNQFKTIKTKTYFYDWAGTHHFPESPRDRSPGNGTSSLFFSSISGQKKILDCRKVIVLMMLNEFGTKKTNNFWATENVSVTRSTFIGAKCGHERSLDQKSKCQNIFFLHRETILSWQDFGFMTGCVKGKTREEIEIRSFKHLPMKGRV